MSKSNGQQEPLIEAQNAGTGHTCRDCRHWHEQEKQQPRGPVVINPDAPKPGECRESVATAAGVQIEPGGQVSIPVKVSYYPATPDNFPACGRFVGRAGVPAQPKSKLLGI